MQPTWDICPASLQGARHVRQNAPTIGPVDLHTQETVAMNELVADLFTLYDQGHTIAIPVNIGWTPGGWNIMGRGVAKEAKNRWPHLPLSWGQYCRALWEGKPRRQAGCLLYPEHRMLMFPTKHLDPANPMMSWKHDSTLDLIELSLKQLSQMVLTPVYLPVPGCGSGKLKHADVVPLCRKYLEGTMHVLVHKKDTGPKSL